LPIFIKRKIEVAAPLVVYNNYNISGINTYIRGGYTLQTGISLYTSGLAYPVANSGTKVLYTRGTIL
jgi:hypothetical protein